MNIAFIGQKGIPTKSGGVEKHVEKIAIRLASLGHQVTVYTRPSYTPRDMVWYRGVRLVSLPSIPTKHLDAITHTFFATLHALFHDFDIIHYQSIGPSILAWIPRYLKPRARVIATFHSRDYFHQKWGNFAKGCLKAAEWFTCHIPERTIVVSETLARYAKRAYHKDLIFIPNGAEIENGGSLDTLRTFGLRPGHYILAVSRLVPHKGLHYLAKAFMELEDTGKLPNNLKLVLVGTQSNTPEYERYLRTLTAGRMNVLLVGERRGKELDTLFRYARCFVQPSEDEGLSMALLEAMAYGLLPIVSDIPANLEAIAGGAGVSFISKDVEDLKQVLAYFVNRPEACRAIGATAEKRIEEYYSWEAIARQTLEVYQGLEREASPRRSYSLSSKHAA